MVAVWEYRIPLPFTLEEYKTAQLYMVAKISASESKGSDGDGVEVLKNEPYVEDNREGQYTHKIYHLASKLPGWLVSLVPKKALLLEEEAWNSYPHCTTIIKCPFFNKFRLILETTHVADCGTTENALHLDAKTLKKRHVEFIDIATDPVENYVEEEDPSKYKSVKTGRGPLFPGWQKNCTPMMCAYKLVTVDVPYWGFGSRLEKFISKQAQRKILLEGHRKCFCWMDEWYGLTMEDIRVMEEETAQALRRARAIALRGHGSDTGEPGDDATEEDQTCSPSSADLLREDRDVAPLRLRDLVSNSSKSSRSNSRNNSRELTNYARQPSHLGSAAALGISSVSVSDIQQKQDGTPRTPSPLKSPMGKPLSQSPPTSLSHAGGPVESLQTFGPANPSLDEWKGESKEYESDSDAAELEKCVDVLDRAIAWAKSRAKSKKQASKQHGPQVHPMETTRSP